MKTLILSVVMFGFVAVAPVFAGGGFDMSQLNADGIIKAGSDVSIGSDSLNSTSTAMEGSNLAAAGAQGSSGVWQIVLSLLIAGGIIAFLVWSFRKSKV